MTAPRKPGPGNPGSLLARPGYDVGYGKPPESGRFQKGKSGNPKGRPKGARNLQPALNEERMMSIIFEEAYRPITVREGTRNITVPIASAVMRSVAVNAVKGNHRSQRLFAELLASAEAAKKAFYEAWLEAAIEYKFGAAREIDRRKRRGITDVDDILPHPDHVVIDVRNGTARVVGPATREEKAKWDEWMARKVAFEDELAGLLEEWQGAADEEERNVILDDIESAQKAISTIARLLDLGG